MTDTTRIAAGAFVRPRELVTLDRKRIKVPGGGLVHLQFRRYAGCPICSLHLRSIARRHADIVAAGVREVIVFHSSAEELAKVQRELPFDVVPDPARRLYVEFGVERSVRSVLDPRAWGAALRAVATGASSDPQAGMADGSFGLPADFLFDSSGRVLASHYGRHADDQWSVDDVLAHAASSAEAASWTR